MADTTTGGMTAHEYHHKFWAGVKKEAADTLARVCREAPPCTRNEVVELLAHALKCGDCTQAAEACIAASTWAHADNEITYKTNKE